MTFSSLISVDTSPTFRYTSRLFDAEQYKRQRDAVGNASPEPQKEAHDVCIVRFFVRMLTAEAFVPLQPQNQVEMTGN